MTDVTRLLSALEYGDPRGGAGMTATRGITSLLPARLLHLSVRRFSIYTIQTKGTTMTNEIAAANK
jgi:hypothetical protein